MRESQSPFENFSVDKGGSADPSVSSDILRKLSEERPTLQQQFGAAVGFVLNSSTSPGAKAQSAASKVDPKGMSTADLPKNVSAPMARTDSSAQTPNLEANKAAHGANEERTKTVSHLVTKASTKIQQTARNATIDTAMADGVSKAAAHGTFGARSGASMTGAAFEVAFQACTGGMVGLAQDLYTVLNQIHTEAQKLPTGVRNEYFSKAYAQITTPGTKQYEQAQSKGLDFSGITAQEFQQLAEMPIEHWPELKEIAVVESKLDEVGANIKDQEKKCEIDLAADFAKACRRDDIEMTSFSMVSLAEANGVQTGIWPMTKAAEAMLRLPKQDVFADNSAVLAGMQNQGGRYDTSRAGNMGGG